MKVKKYHVVEGIRIEKGSIHLVVDGKRIEKELKDLSPRLAAASEEGLGKFEVSPSGYGIRWPVLDEDISIDALLGIAHHPDSSRKSA
ncbi:MAG TPA: DUF2442 domain-containing protein [Gammaproteobacteria bacterium]|nr:DUF2442 domain-containing protein [Gammaproteobacteria bacterium]